MEGVNISCRITEVILIINGRVSRTSLINILRYRDVMFMRCRYRRNAGGFDKHCSVPAGATINALFQTAMCYIETKAERCRCLYFDFRQKRGPG